MRMIVIEVRLNGELKAICGTDDIRQLVGTVTAGRRQVPSEANSEGYVVECMGVRPNDAETDEVLKWVSARIQLGDEVSFRIVEADKAHKPIDRQLIAGCNGGPNA
jgi:hypothetical protein